MKPTEHLKEEHREIELMFNILQKVCQKLESGEDVSPEHLEQISEFLKVYVDVGHHGEEEDLLFPAIQEADMSKHGGPIELMLMEHNVGRNYVKIVSEAITRYNAGDRIVSGNIVKHARIYIAHMANHIEKEETIVFAMADAQIPKEKQEELLEEFERLENEKMGIGKEEELQKVLHHLEEIYLKPLSGG